MHEIDAQRTNMTEIGPAGNRSLTTYFDWNIVVIFRQDSINHERSSIGNGLVVLSHSLWFWEYANKLLYACKHFFWMIAVLRMKSTWANADRDLCRRMAALGHDEFINDYDIWWSSNRDCIILNWDSLSFFLSIVFVYFVFSLCLWIRWLYDIGSHTSCNLHMLWYQRYDNLTCNTYYHDKCDKMGR